MASYCKSLDTLNLNNEKIYIYSTDIQHQLFNYFVFKLKVLETKSKQINMVCLATDLLFIIGTTLQDTRSDIKVKYYTWMYSKFQYCLSIPNKLTTRLFFCQEDNFH